MCIQIKMKKLIRKYISILLNYIVDIVFDKIEKRYRPNPLFFYQWYEAHNSYLKYKDVYKDVFVSQNRKDLRSFCIGKVKENFSNYNNLLFMELGVCSGNSIRHFSELIKSNVFQNHSIHGFDSFEGLEENWNGMIRGRLKGAYATSIPKVPNNIVLHKGWVQDTLPPFLEEKSNLSKKIGFVHFDMDTYSPTKFALKVLSPRFVKGTTLLFDDFYGGTGTVSNEHKAYLEIFENIPHKIIAFGTYQAVVEIL